MPNVAISTIGVIDADDVMGGAISKGKTIETAPSDEDNKNETKEEKEKPPSCLKRRDSYFDEPSGRWLLLTNRYFAMEIYISGFSL